MSGENKGNVYRLGINVFIFLVVLTILEYFVAIIEIPEYSPTVPLFIIAFIKAAAIINWFMHIYRLWRTDEEGH